MFDIYQENYCEEISVQSYWYEDLHENSRFSQELSRQVELQQSKYIQSPSKSSSGETNYVPLTQIFKV